MLVKMKPAAAAKHTAIPKPKFASNQVPIQAPAKEEKPKDANTGDNDQAPHSHPADTKSGTRVPPSVAGKKRM